MEWAGGVATLGACISCMADDQGGVVGKLPAVLNLAR